MDVRVKEFRANKISMSVSNKEPGIFVYTDSWFPGWQARVDGKSVPVRKAFHAYKSVELDSGDHEVEFIFINKSVPSIIIMNVVCWGLFIGLLAQPLLRRWSEFQKQVIANNA